jgi:hypothetical protein
MTKGVVGKLEREGGSSPADDSSACHTMASGCAQLETPLPGSPIQGTPEGNAKLIRYRAGVQVDANGNPINRDATGGRK